MLFTIILVGNALYGIFFQANNSYNAGKKGLTGKNNLNSLGNTAHAISLQSKDHFQKELLAYILLGNLIR